MFHSQIRSATEPKSDIKDHKKKMCCKRENHRKCSSHCIEHLFIDRETNSSNEKIIKHTTWIADENYIFQQNNLYNEGHLLFLNKWYKYITMVNEIV